MTSWSSGRARARRRRPGSRACLAGRQARGVAVLAALSLAPALASAAEPPGRLAGPPAGEAGKKALVFVADAITWLDVAACRTPNLDRLLAQSAIAAMSCAPAAPASSERSYITLGAGSRATDTGMLKGPPLEQRDGHLSVVGIAQLHQANERLTYEVEVGALGSALRQAGLETAVVGNADWEHPTQGRVDWRWAMAIAMDERGLVDDGEVGASLLRRQEGNGTRLRTDQGALLAELDRCLQAADLIVIESGDTGRASRLLDAGVMAGEARTLKQQALEQTDRLLGEVLTLAHPDWLLVFVTPSPSRSEFRWLTPLVVRSPQHGGGLLTSGTTLRSGLVATIDLAPTVLDYFGLASPASFTGRPVRASPAAPERRLRSLQAMSLRSHETDLLRRFFFPCFVACEMAFLGLWALALHGWPRPWPRRGWGGVAALQLAILAGPTACFLAHILAPASWPPPALFGLIVALAIAQVALAMRLSARPLAPVLLIAGLQAVIIIADALTGARLQLASVFGYSPVVGGRFYGIGNEGISLLLGGGMMAAAACLHTMAKHDPDGRASRALPGPDGPGAAPIAAVSLFFLLCTVVIGLPKLGANAGGTIAAVAGYSAMVFVLLSRRRRLPLVLLTVGLVALFLALLVTADVRQPVDEQTHIGRAFRAVAEGGWPAFWRLATHRLTRNLSMLFSTIWMVPLVGWTLSMTWALFRPVSAVRDTYLRCPALRAAAIGCAVGGAVGFVFNDTGIAIPAIVISWAVYAISYTAAIPRAPAQTAAR